MNTFKLVFFLFPLFFSQLYFAQKTYTLENLKNDLQAEKYKRIIDHNEHIKSVILPTIESEQEYIRTVTLLYNVNKIEFNQINSMEYAQLYLDFFDKKKLEYPQYYLNGLKYCAESAYLLNQHDLTISYSTLGLSFLNHNGSLNKDEKLFFMELQAEAYLNSGMWKDSAPIYRNLLMSYRASGVEDSLKFLEAEFGLACSYFGIELYNNAEPIFKRIYVSKSSSVDLKIQSKFLNYLSLLMSNKYSEADKMHGHLKSEIKSIYGKNSVLYHQMVAAQIINLCGLGEMYLKSNNVDSLKLAENLFEDALKIGKRIEKKMNQFPKDFQNAIYSTISLVHLFSNNTIKAKEFAELGGNNILTTLCYIRENKPKMADSVFFKQINQSNKKFQVNANLSISENLLLKRRMLSFNEIGIMNYLNLWEPKRLELNNMVYENWLNFNGESSYSTYLNYPESAQINKLKAKKNKIKEGLLTTEEMNLIKALNDSVLYLEEQFLSKHIEPKRILKIEDLKMYLTKDEVFIDIVETRNFDFTQVKLKEGTTYNFFVIKKYDDSFVEHVNASLSEDIILAPEQFDTLTINYETSWKPIADKIGDAKTVYVSLGGVYNNINLNTIYNPTTGKYLLEEKDIRIVNSAREFILNKERETKTYTNNTASLFGFPNFDGNTTVSVDSSDLFASTRDLNSFWLDSLTRGGLKAKPLPATKTEVENISATLKSKGWQVTNYLADNASETNLKTQQSPRVLHVATHGYFFPDIPMEDKDQTRFLGMDRQQVAQDPMLRSGLLLTGANRTLKGEVSTGENGLLSAAEASLLDLRETELVVLSACETGKGEVKNSEGVYGLRKAFSDAGAQNIIMSLWKVDDKVTQEFMTRFYQLWLNDKTTIREAFHRTQLEIKAKYPQPYYWGAFILVGE